jgi:hypothetical protein
MAWGPEADRRTKLLIRQAGEGSLGRLFTLFGPNRQERQRLRSRGCMGCRCVSPSREAPAARELPSRNEILKRAAETIAREIDLEVRRTPDTPAM